MNTEIAKSISLGEFTAAKIFKLGFFCNLGFWGIVAVVFGILGAFGYDVVKWNDENVYGVTALLTALFAGLMLTIVGSTILMLGGVVAAWGARRFGFGDLGVIEKLD